MFNNLHKWFLFFISATVKNIFNIKENYTTVAIKCFIQEFIAENFIQIKKNINFSFYIFEKENIDHTYFLALTNYIQHNTIN